MLDAKSKSGILDADSHPEVRCPRQRAMQLGEPLGALGEYLILMPVGLAHDTEDALNEFVRNPCMEEIAH